MKCWADAAAIGNVTQKRNGAAVRVIFNAASVGGLIHSDAHSRSIVAAGRVRRCHITGLPTIIASAYN